MSDYYAQLAEKLQSTLQGKIVNVEQGNGEVTVIVTPENLIDVSTILRDDEKFRCEQLIDVCGVDYSEYQGSMRPDERFAVVYHLLSVGLNHRIRVRTFAAGEMPMVPSVVDIWSSANWFEREAFDMFGIVFDGHPDLRRILTDYGFIGHPFRKDFPISGHVEMRYDEEKRRVIYEPVSIDPRDQIPKVIRDDHRYMVAEVEKVK
ncbi:MAG: NADH-quinone oxidoreductase subunit C [Gammaproteobacteria bacterium]|nr:NADH-quinone oxidoreductase subunit C [Gammaproteobacteria bacterium]